MRTRLSFRDRRTVVITIENSVVSLTGEIDLATVEGVEAAIKPFVNGGGPVVLDVSRVTFMDTAGLHLLVAEAIRLRGRGCLILHGANGQVLRLLEMSHQLSGEDLSNIHMIPCEVLAPNGALAGASQGMGR